MTCFRDCGKRDLVNSAFCSRDLRKLAESLHAIPKQSKLLVAAVISSAISRGVDEWRPLIQSALRM
jgi:hypothetical protein